MPRVRRNQPSGLLIAGITAGVAILGVMILFAVWIAVDRPAEPALLIDATDLANEYRENPAATVAKLRGKNIELSNVNVKRMNQGFGALWNLDCEFPIRGTDKAGTYRIRCSEKFAASVDKNFIHTFHVVIGDDLLGEMCLIIR